MNCCAKPCECDQLRAQLAAVESVLKNGIEADYVVAAAERRAAEAEAEVGRLKRDRERQERVNARLATERDALRAEVEMLRGVGCNEDGDGPCGACLKCARAEVERLRAELENKEAYVEYIQSLDAADLSFDNDRLRAALRKYGHHVRPCPWHWAFGREYPRVDLGEKPCTCGLDAALNGAGGAGEYGHHEEFCGQCGWSGTGFHACPGHPGENEG
jgi:hypothetical protein